MQLEKLDGHIKPSNLAWLSTVDIANLNPKVFQKFMQLCMLASAKFGNDEGIDFERIYQQLGD
jgi:hypothetical protein